MPHGLSGEGLRRGPGIAHEECSGRDGSETHAGTRTENGRALTDRNRGARVRRGARRDNGAWGRSGPAPRIAIGRRFSSKVVGSRATEVAPNRRIEVFQLASVLGVQSACLPVFALNGLVHFLAVHGDFDRGRDPQPNLIAPDIHHGDNNVITNDDAFVAVSGQNQHLLGSFLLPTRSVTVPDHVARALGNHDGAFDDLGWHVAFCDGDCSSGHAVARSGDGPGSRVGAEA